jgi:hypothetical protein
MSIRERFASYAADFEKVFVSDDWVLLKQYFAEDACYITRGFTNTETQGRDAVLKTLQNNVANFDRLFDSRELTTLTGPNVDKYRLSRNWQCRFTLAGAPDLVIQGVETVTYVGELIVQLEEEIVAESQKNISAWLRRYQSKLATVAHQHP